MLRKFAERYVATLFVMGVLAVSLSGCPSVTPAIVFFEDAELEEAVRDALDHPLGLLTSFDLLALEHLNASDLGITDISGLEYCLNLNFLDLSGNSISDLSPLDNLPLLAVLDLDSNNIFDIEPLSRLRNLDALNICGNTIYDLQPLHTNMTNHGLGSGDYVAVDTSGISDMSETVYIPELIAAGVEIIECGGSTVGEDEPTE